NSSCLCESGSVLCDGRCVVLENDPRNCGACGDPCPQGQACQDRACVATCTLGVNTFCGGSCVNLQSDPHHCGACDAACENSESCHAGHCSWDLVAACFTTGQVVGVSSTDVRGPLQSLGTGPISLAAYGSVLLAADSLDNRL